MKRKLIDILVWLGMVLPLGAITMFMWIGAEYVIDKEVHFGYVDIFMTLLLVNAVLTNMFSGRRSK